MAGITDVARLAGVSKATASRALTGAGPVSVETRRRVKSAAQELGYVASTTAVSLATGRTNAIGVVMPYVNRWFFAEVLEGIQRQLLERGMDLTLYDAKPGTAGRRRIFESYLARKRFDGLIAVGLEPQDDELQRMITLSCPIVSVVGDDSTTNVVSVDDDHAVRRATEHLIGLGHRRIAFLGGGGGGDSRWAHVDRRRFAGYSASMTDAGLDAFVVHARSGVTLPEGYASAVDLLSDSRRRLTAIVGVCDEVAIGAIIAARRLGVSVPRDLSVIGIDDHEYAEMFSLTTLKQLPREQGADAVDVLLGQIEGTDRAIVQILRKARLVMRSSTAPPS